MPDIKRNEGVSIFLMHPRVVFMHLKFKFRCELYLKFLDCLSGFVMLNVLFECFPDAFYESFYCRSSGLHFS